MPGQPLTPDQIGGGLAGLAFVRDHPAADDLTQNRVDRLLQNSSQREEVAENLDLVKGQSTTDPLP